MWVSRAALRGQDDVSLTFRYRVPGPVQTNVRKISSDVISPIPSNVEEQKEPIEKKVDETLTKFEPSTDVPRLQIDQKSDPILKEIPEKSKAPEVEKTTVDYAKPALDNPPVKTSPKAPTENVPLKSDQFASDRGKESEKEKKVDDTPEEKNYKSEKSQKLEQLKSRQESSRREREENLTKSMKEKKQSKDDGERLDNLWKRVMKFNENLEKEHGISSTKKIGNVILLKETGWNSDQTSNNSSNKEKSGGCKHEHLKKKSQTGKIDKKKKCSMKDEEENCGCHHHVHIVKEEVFNARISSSESSEPETVHYHSRTHGCSHPCHHHRQDREDRKEEKKDDGKKRIDKLQNFLINPPEPAKAVRKVSSLYGMTTQRETNSSTNAFK